MLSLQPSLDAVFDKSGVIIGKNHPFLGDAEEIRSTRVLLSMILNIDGIAPITGIRNCCRAGLESRQIRKICNFTPRNRACQIRTGEFQRPFPSRALLSNHIGLRWHEPEPGHPHRRYRQRTDEFHLAGIRILSCKFRLSPPSMKMLVSDYRLQESTDRKKVTQ